MAIVKLSEVRKSYGTLAVLKDVSLQVERGSVVALVGRSGSGKMRQSARTAPGSKTYTVVRSRLRSRSASRGHRLSCTSF